MFEIFQKSKLYTSFFPRKSRAELDGDIYIKRHGKTTFRANRGNISDGGLYVEIHNHDLQKGKKVEIVLVSQIGSIKRMSRMMGIVIRTDENGVAMVTYNKEDLKSPKDLAQLDSLR